MSYDRLVSMRDIAAHVVSERRQLAARVENLLQPANQLCPHIEESSIREMLDWLRRDEDDVLRDSGFAD